MGYELLEKPLTEKEINETNGSIDVVIAVPVNTIINLDFENLMDLFEELTIATGVLCDVNYTMVGCSAKVNDTIHFQIEAEVEAT